MGFRFRHELLAKARVELGMTQQQAAAALGVDVRTYRRYESGEVNEPGGFAVQRASRRAFLGRIAREFGLAEDELLVDWTEPATGIPPATVGGHVLPRAAHFVGRSELVSILVQAARETSPDARVVAVVGVGGAGKTAVVERALTLAAVPAFVFSFYDDPRVDVFFESARSWFDPGSDPAGRGELVEGLARTLARADRGLLVLDGLETVQSTGETGRTRGELEDSRLRLFLRQVVRGLGSTRVIVTSRFPLADLVAWEGSGLRTHGVPGLSAEESSELLARWGLQGKDDDHKRLFEAVGGHALSVAVIGSYVGSFLDGDPARFADVEWAEAARDDVLARRLGQVLDSYGRGLAPLERDVLSLVCAFPRGTSLASLDHLAASGLPVAGALAGQGRGALVAALARLTRVGLVFAQGDRYSAHPFVRQHFQARIGDGVRAVHENERARLLGRLDMQPDAPPTLPDQLDAYESLFEHTLLCGRVEDAATLYLQGLRGFGHLGLRIGELARGQRMVRALASRPHGSGGDDPSHLSTALPPRMRARLAYQWGLYAAALGDLALAIRCYEVSVELERANDDVVGWITGLRTLAYTHRLRGEASTAKVCLERSITMARGHGITEALVRGMALMGALYTDEGVTHEAERCFAEVRALGDVPVARRSLWETEFLLATGRRDLARAETEQNLALCERLGWDGHAAHCHVVLGGLDLLEGRSARAHLAPAQRWCKHSGEVEMKLRTLELEARVLHHEGEHEAASRVVEQGRELAGLGGFGPFRRTFDELARAQGKDPAPS